MNRKQRFEAIAVCPPTVLAKLAEQVLTSGATVQVLREPQGGMVMLRVRESVERTLFNLGEVTVTEAEVEIAGRRGYAMTMGLSRERALAGAIVDAAVEAGHPLQPTLEAALAVAVREREAQRAARWQQVAATRVQFDEIPS